MATTTPTSFRLHPDAVTLIAAWAAFMAAAKRRDVGRSEALETLLLSAKPPSTTKPEAQIALKELRAAFDAFKDTR